MSSIDFYNQFKDFGKFQLSEARQALAWAENDLYARYLCQVGFVATSGVGDFHFDLVLVSHPSDPESEWATPEECQQLLDTVANLEPEQAWGRWVWKKPYRTDLSIFDDLPQSLLSKLRTEFLQSQYGQQFMSDVKYINRYFSEMRKDTIQLRADRKAMQLEFLSTFTGTISDSDLKQEVLRLGQKYGFGRNITRDALAYAMANRHKFS